MTLIRVQLTYKWEAADMEQMKLEEDEQGQDPNDVHHSIQEVAVLVIYAVHVEVDQFHL